MFQFPRCPLGDCAPSARPCAGRVAPFGHPRIAGCQRLPGAFRRVAASFLGRQRQGIHHAPIMRISCYAPSGRIVTCDRRPARASGMVPSGRTRCRVGPTPPGVLCVFSLLYCMVRVSARGRADTSPRCTRSGAPADSGQARPTRVRPQGPSPSPAAAEPHGFRVAHCQSADDPRAVVATRRSSWRRRRRRREVVKPRPKSCPDLGGDLPTCWRSRRARLASLAHRGRPEPGTRPPAQKVEPRGFEPRTSAVQGRRSPS
jgi:hypothetical protein